jgi:hypothetical protein
MQVTRVKSADLSRPNLMELWRCTRDTVILRLTGFLLIVCRVSAGMFKWRKFNLQTTIMSSDQLRKTSFDRYDRNNNDSERNWLLASVDGSLKKDISECLSFFNGFTSHRLQMIHLIELTCTSDSTKLPSKAMPLQ